MSGHNHSMEMPMIPKPEQAHWALQEAAIRAEINQAKANVDLLRMANAVARLDKLHSEMEAAGESNGGWDVRTLHALCGALARPVRAALQKQHWLRCSRFAVVRWHGAAVARSEPARNPKRSWISSLARVGTIARHRPSAAARLPTLHEVV